MWIFLEHIGQIPPPVSYRAGTGDSFADEKTDASIFSAGVRGAMPLIR
jgi:hypothetical protein